MTPPVMTCCFQLACAPRPIAATVETYRRPGPARARDYDLAGWLSVGGLVLGDDGLMASRVPFYFVDVFATGPLTGNPLSLVPDADGLDEAQMRAIAREFNQSETTFVLRTSLPNATVLLRSFTPAGAEVGGAGHNALGAWLWMEAAGRLPAAGGD